MKITCESCGAHYDLDEARIPASGLTMKCPACLHQFQVRRSSAGPPAPAPEPPKRREIELSSLEDDPTPLPSSAPGLVAPKPDVRAAFEEMDLPAPKATAPKPGVPKVTAPKPAAPSPPLPPISRDKPLMEVEPTRDDAAISISLSTGALGEEDVIDLPAPVTPGSRPAPQLDSVDLPAPKAPKPPPPKPAAGVSPPKPAAEAPPPKPFAAAPPPRPAAEAPPPRPAAEAPPPKPAAAAPPPKPATAAPPPKLAAAPPPKPAAAPPPKSGGASRAPEVASSNDPNAAIGLEQKGHAQSFAPIDDTLDLPAPKGKPMSPLQLADEGPDLVAPKRGPSPPRTPSVPAGIDLDAPDPDDLDVVAPSRSPRTATLDFEGPPAVDLDSIDVVAPKRESESQSEIGLLAPKAESFEVAPKLADRSLDDPTPLEAQKVELPLTRPVLPPKDKKAEPKESQSEQKPRRGLTLALIAGGGVLLLVGAVGVGLGVFTDQGYFGSNLWSHHRPGDEAKLMAARKLLADDTLASYLKAGLDLRALNEGDAQSRDAAALEAQAHLCAARLGSSSEAKAGELLLGKLGSAEGQGPAGPSTDLRKAQALKALVAGRTVEARSQLQALLATAPSDASSLVYLGWTELAAGDFAAADAAFSRALAAEQTRSAALYGAGLAKERLGDAAAAQDYFARTLARSPTHFGAALGAARLGPAKPAKEKIDELISKRSAVAAPRELADAWSSLGVLAATAGRRDEAEDRLKRALQLDPELTAAKVALAGVRCDVGKCAEMLPALAKIVGAQPKNLQARLALVRAQAETGAPAEAARTLADAAAQAPKDARVLYWQGRVALVTEPPDRDKALGFFKQAVGADPKYIAAYLAESTTFAQLGKADDALEALRQAEAKASDDPQLMTELGQAYLGLGKGADAEARFRAALDKRPDLHVARMELGAALEAQDKPNDAALEYEAVAKADPEYPGLAERQARLAVKQGKKELAWELYQKALKSGVPTHALRLQAAGLALELGRGTEALQLASSVLKEDDRSALGHLWMARAQLQLGHPDDAMVEARRAATIADLPEAHLQLGYALEALNKLDQAVQEYQLARRPPVEAEATLGRARILVRMGATRDALAELTGLAKDPKLKARALLLLGDCYADLQQPDKAKKAYEEAVKSGPELGDAAFKLGRVYLDGGKRKPAVEMLERALRLGGDKAPYAVEAWLLSGDAHRESRESEAAVRAYQKYLELAPPDAPARAEVKRHLSLLGGK